MQLSESRSGSIYQELIIDGVREEIKDFKIFTFRDGHHLKYKSGQFITLVDNSGPEEIRRSYSIISSPDLNEPLAIAVKRVDNGFFSRKLVDHAKKGDRLLTTGAAGFFVLPDHIHSFTRIFLFAAGSGIAPVFSLIKTVLHFHPGIKLRLIYSNRSAGTTAFYKILKELELKFPGRLQTDFLFSTLSDLRRARLNRELLLEILSFRPFDPVKSLFYTCGPETYMRMILFLLLEEGFQKENIKKEDFNPGNKKSVIRMPPDKNDYRVHLKLNGISYDFPVQYPDSILQAARKQKIVMPYSCETGKCGSCAAVCISGKVWLSHNEVLTEEELRKGITLTCTGHPQGGNLSLIIK